MALRRIRWGWVLIGGIVAELALMLFVPIQFLSNGATILATLVIPLCVIATALAGLWIARKAAVAQIAHGALVGTVALAIYVALTWGQDLPGVYVVANYLKIVGGAAGGWWAARYQTPSSGA